MKQMGGDIEFSGVLMHSCLTETGRSSLRFILRSGLKGRRFLLPDYLCQVIPDTFDQEGVRYSYYRINGDFSIDWESVNKNRYDALYVINYFGHTPANIAKP